MLIEGWFLLITGVMHCFGWTVVSSGVEGLIRKQRGSQNNFTDKFQAGIPPDVTV